MASLGDGWKMGWWIFFWDVFFFLKIVFWGFKELFVWFNRGLMNWRKNFGDEREFALGIRGLIEINRGLCA